jgi:hypothetical protein
VFWAVFLIGNICWLLCLIGVCCFGVVSVCVFLCSFNYGSFCYFLIFLFVRVLINNQIFHSSFLKAVELVSNSSELLQKRQNFICRFILIHRFHPQFFATLDPNYGSTASSLKKITSLNVF